MQIECNTIKYDIAVMVDKKKSLSKKSDCEKIFSRSRFRLHIKPEVHHITVFHQVLLPFYS